MLVVVLVVVAAGGFVVLVFVVYTGTDEEADVVLDNSGLESEMGIIGSGTLVKKFL